MNGKEFDTLSVNDTRFWVKEIIRFKENYEDILKRCRPLDIKQGNTVKLYPTGLISADKCQCDEKTHSQDTAMIM